MKKRSEENPRAGVPYFQQEVDLILSLVPTNNNVTNLAKSLGRTEDAIRMVYQEAYSGNWLKDDKEKQKRYQDNIVTKIVQSKKRLGIIIGHEPK